MKRPDRFENLRKLVKLLEIVPPEKFWMATWNYSNSCGFAGCACGWAAHNGIIPGFVTPKYTNEVYYVDANGDRLRGFEAAAKAFKIGVKQARYLFDPQQYRPAYNIKPKIVAARIRKFIREKTRKAVS